MFSSTTFKLSIIYLLLFPITMLNANKKQDLNALNVLTSTMQNLSKKAKNSALDQASEKSKSSSDKSFSLWHEKHCSIVQLYVLDQFLTVNTFLNTPYDIGHNEDELTTIFKQLDNNVKKDNYKKPLVIVQNIAHLKNDLKLKLQKAEINPQLNIGGGEESCGYQAIKNALLISNYSETGFELYRALNDIIYANTLFGTTKVNKVLNIHHTQDLLGPWRKIVIDHRITLQESSLATTIKVMQKSLSALQEELRQLLILINEIQISDSNTQTMTKIKHLWENIIRIEVKMTLEVANAEQKAKDAGTLKAKEAISEISNILINAKELINSHKHLLPVGIFTKEVAIYDLDDYENDEEENEDYDSSDDDYEEDLDDQNDEPMQIDILDTLNLNQSEKEGDFLDVSDIDYLYKRLKATSSYMPNSTTVGSLELSAEPLESKENVEEDVANEIFDRIIKKVQADSLNQHIIFIGGGSHWATVVIKIINSKLYYIIADSTNEPRYGVNLKQKGIFITKAIQKIIDGTKDSLLKLVT